MYPYADDFEDLPEPGFWDWCAIIGLVVAWCALFTLLVIVGVACKVVMVVRDFFVGGGR